MGYSLRARKKSETESLTHTHTLLGGVKGGGLASSVRRREGSGRAWSGEEGKGGREAQRCVSQQHLGVPGLKPPS